MNGPSAEALTSIARAYVRYAPGTLGKSALAAGYLNPRLRDHPRRHVVRTRFGARFAADTQDLIQRYVYLFGVWEPHLTHWLQGRLRPGDTFIDVGANVGYDTVLGATLVGDGGRVVAVEASPPFHRAILRQAELNGLTNVRAVNAAASARTERLTFTLASSHNMGANSIVPYDGPTESTFTIDAAPLPELLTEAELTGARVIKIDVEGAEGSVIRGLAPALPRLRPDAEIAIEVTPERMAKLGDSVEVLLATMRVHGFHAYRIPNDYRPQSYPPAIGAPRAPARLRGEISGECDVIFSRVDAEALP